MKVTIESKFQGPPNSGNGGYVCGLLGKHSNLITEVTLRKPAPLEKELIIKKQDGLLNLMDGENLIAVAKNGQLDITIPGIPSIEEASLASKNYIGNEEDHCFPNCFVCGPLRKEKEGLNIFVGRVGQSNIYAATWTPSIQLANGNNSIKTEFIWSALDCPGAFAAMKDKFNPLVLGRMTGQVFEPIKYEKPHIVIGWEFKEEGRKHFTGTAIFNEKKELAAAASSIWFEIDPLKY